MIDRYEMINNNAITQRHGKSLTQVDETTQRNLSIAHNASVPLCCFNSVYNTAPDSRRDIFYLVAFLCIFSI